MLLTPRVVTVVAFVVAAGAFAPRVRVRAKVGALERLFLFFKRVIQRLRRGVRLRLNASAAALANASAVP